MNKRILLKKIKNYFADKYECDVKEFKKKGLNIIKNKKENKLKMLLFHDLLLVSTSNNLYDLVNEKLKSKNIYEIFEFPLAYGQSIYFVPDLKRITKQDETDGLTFKLFDGNTMEIDLTSGFENAITFKNGKCISEIAYCAFDGKKIIGVAGADRINDDIWKVGIEILPEYRKDELETILIKNLTVKILEKGIVPIWCASSIDIESQKVADKSNYIPLWFETLDDEFVYKELIKPINAQKEIEKLEEINLKENVQKIDIKLRFIMIFTLICVLCWWIFAVFVTDFYILLGVIISSISIMCLSVLYLILTFYGLYVIIKEKRIKDFLSILPVVIFFLILLSYGSFNLMNGIKDCIIGPKEIVIEDYEVTKSRHRYNIIDKDGNKYRSQLNHYISEHEKGIKIIYYENLKMIKYFEYN